MSAVNWGGPEGLGYHGPMTSSKSVARVVVTGGAGFIGTHTVALLLAQGARVLVIDDLRHACGVEVPPEADRLEADLSTSAALQALARFQPTAVLHLAAQGGVSRSLRDPAADAVNNVVATLALLRAVVDAGRPRFVFASSGGAIYGRARRLPTKETAPARPLAPYGAAKLAGEVYLGMFQRTFKLSYAALRYGNVYGPHQDGTGEAGMVAISCRRLLQGEPPRVTGTGEQTRDFVYVGDVARANLLALGSRAQGPINIGTGRPTSILTVARTLTDLAGLPVDPEFVPARPGEVPASYLDPARARARLGWAPEVPLEEGLKLTLESFRTAA
jgi:UDP-glucose 4-epimerase